MSKHQKEVYQVYEPYLGNLNKSKVKALENTVEKYQHIDEDFDSLKNQYQENELPINNINSRKLSYKKKSSYGTMLNEVFEKSQIYPQYLVYGKGYSAIYAFRMIDRDMKDSLVFIMATIVLLSGLYVENKEQENLLITTKNGKTKRARAKWLNAILWGGVIFILINGLSYLHFSLLYPMTQPDAPIGAIDLSAQTLVFPLSSEMSVFEYGMALCATRIFGFISLIILCVFISRKCHNRILTICILAAILFFPVCLYLADVELVKVFSLFDLIMGNLFLQKTFSTVKIILLMLMDMLMIISIHREMKEE